MTNDTQDLEAQYDHAKSILLDHLSPDAIEFLAVVEALTEARDHTVDPEAVFDLLRDMLQELQEHADVEL